MPPRRGQGLAPGSPARGAAIVSEHEGLETARGGFQSTDGVFTCPGESAHGFICHRGDRDRGEIPRAGQPGPWHGVSAVGVAPSPRFFGNQRGRPHPAVVTVFCQIAGEPVAPGAGFVDEDQLCGLRWPLADELIHVTLAGADAAEGDALSLGLVATEATAMESLWTSRPT